MYVTVKNFLLYFLCRLFISLISLGAHLPYFPSWSLTKHQFSSVQSLSRVQLFATPWTAARQASLSITNSRSLLKLTSIELVRPSNHLIFCHPLLLRPSIFSSIRVFSNELALRIRRPKYWSFRSVLPMNIQGWFPLGLNGLISLQSKRLSRIFSNTTVQKHNSSAISFLYSPSLTSNWKNHSLTRWTFVGKVMSLLSNTLSGFVIVFLPRSIFQFHGCSHQLH